MLNYYFKDYLSVFQNYGNQTRVIRLKVAPNMADPISFNVKRPYSLKLKEDETVCISNCIEVKKSKIFNMQRASI